MAGILVFGVEYVDGVPVVRRWQGVPVVGAVPFLQRVGRGVDLFAIPVKDVDFHLRVHIEVDDLPCVVDAVVLWGEEVWYYQLVILGGDGRIADTAQLVADADFVFPFWQGVLYDVFQVVSQSEVVLVVPSAANAFYDDGFRVFLGCDDAWPLRYVYGHLHLFYALAVCCLHIVGGGLFWQNGVSVA